MVPLGERLRYMQWFRLVSVALLVAIRIFSPEVYRVGLVPAAVAMAGYLAVSALTGKLWHLAKRPNLPLFGAMLLVDGVFLAYMGYATGASLSPVRYLVLVHLIVVTLLASHRTGLKLAFWHSLLLFVVHHAQEADLLEPVEGVYGALPGTDYQRLSTFVAAFWVVALATAAFSAVNERELRRRRVDLEALAQMAKALEKAHTPRQVAKVLADSLAETFGFERLVVMGEPKGEPVLLAFHGPDPGDEARQLSQGVDAIVRDAWERRETILVREIDPEANPRLSRLLPDAHNLVVTPLLAEDRPIGVAVAEHAMRHGSRIEQRVVAMVSQFASHAALAIDNAWLLEQVQEMAETDGLTGVANRRTFESALELEVARAFRNKEKVSLVMADIDHFKRLNDNHGHQTGDEVLRVVAGALQGECRDFDTVARYGGEEFAVILPACPEEMAVEIAERLRQSVVDAKTVVPVTVSAGVATFPVNGLQPSGLVQAADEALYESKRAGRDRVTRSGREALDSDGSEALGSSAPVGGSSSN